jgi:hypothetical protein
MLIEPLALHGPIAAMPNDVAMFRNSGFPSGNASPEVKAQASA